ncbi:CRISPR-associated protein, Cmr2 family [Candidatus Defluviicoccus seviourii]|uniref:CRISPR-associated protein, Cmr2 family n=2 Tax=root TaxID=1 RepID=A0A564WES5_9PROT|nr:CRISPR-associated protein, Cmr2 family [uncultured Defluviicoccus sp.]VUX46997.1 CRISPR-associated protein, Cmr2 family [Candidatus Defluviicoccus seviourii]
MNDNKHILHFSLGPVQGFIGTARRTRDLWAGSFLLSWLSAVALVEVRKKGGKIRFPRADADPMVARLEKRSNEEPRIGTVPNRFKAEVPQNFDPSMCKAAIDGAWKQLAAAVRADFISKVASGGNNTQSIWDRQVENFWEISWVKGEQGGNDGAWLDNRKSWRSHQPHDENTGGDHCTLMGDWQEISGYVRAREGARRKPDGSKDENRQDKFWNAFRELDDWKGNKLLLDIVEGERLCAIALIKRLFPRLTKESREEVFGWDPCRDGGGNWPSTGHIAAAHWINKAMKLDNGACERYAQYIDNNFSDLHFAEQYSGIPCVTSIPRANRDEKHWFGALDANFFDENDLKNRRAMPLLNYKGVLFDKPEDEGCLRNKVITLLKAITDDVGVPAGYFALLRMDGDNVGTLLEALGDQKVSEALQRFTVRVQDLVRKNNGVLIYAGGDDVLALFPIEDALKAALELRRAYVNAWPGDDPQTISAGLVFADHHEPFRHVVEESRRLLEDVAKDKNGRDSIACSVLKPSRKAVEWVATWTLSDCSFLTEKIGEIAAQMRDDRPFSTRFIYNLRTRFLDPIGDRFEELNLKPNELEAILAAERSGSRELPKEDGDKEERKQRERELIRTIRQISRPHTNEATGPRGDTTGEPLQTDALMLARFLAQKGLKVEGDKK